MLQQQHHSAHLAILNCSLAQEAQFGNDASFAAGGQARRHRTVTSVAFGQKASRFLIQKFCCICHCCITIFQCTAPNLEPILQLVKRSPNFSSLPLASSCSSLHCAGCRHDMHAAAVTLIPHTPRSLAVSLTQQPQRAERLPSRSIISRLCLVACAPIAHHSACSDAGIKC